MAPFEELWDAILDLTAQFVIPDWASVIDMIPIALTGVIVLWLLWTIRRFATAGPTRRGKQRIAPIAPAGTHLGPASYAPIFGAIGTFLLLWGLVFGGLALWLGLAALVLTLLYWGREAQADYEHTEPVRETLPAVVGEPPPGVHIPGPSFRPVLGALATGGLMFGIVFGGWVLAVSVIFLIVTLLGWLRDARGEYGKTLEADETGHLESLPAPNYPGTLLAAFLVLAVVASAADAGILPPRDGAAGQPGPGGPEDPEADVVIHALNIQFEERAFSAPAGASFTIGFVNLDANIPHNVEIKSPAGASIFQGEIFNGVDVRVYDVPALDAGAYPFVCTVHPNMTGTATIE